MSLAQLQIHTHPLPYRDLSFDMVEIQGGTFLLGDEVKTTISDFQLGQHLVSQALWQEIMGKNPSHWQGDDRPVEKISWYDCVEFCNELSRRMKLEPYYEIDKERKDPNNLSDFDDLKWWVRPIAGADGFRLPTEAEWVYAAEGGIYCSYLPFAGSVKFSKVGWYKDNSFAQTHPQALLLPNALGLYDMSGQLDEWCGDWTGDYKYGPLYDPQGPESGRRRVVKGGSWCYEESSGKLRNSFHGDPDARNIYNSLRLSRTTPEQSEGSP